MKLLSLCSALLLLLLSSGRITYFQVVYTAPVGADISKTDEQYVYKGDSIDVVYSFWGDGGVMAFMVLNKSKSPIYIDWTKSAYIDQKTNEPYYPVNSRGASEAFKSPQDAYHIFAPYILSGYVGAENGLTEMPVTLLPPKSYLFRTNYRILPNTPLSVKKLKPTEIPFISGMRETFPGWVMNSDSTNAMLTFENSIVYDAQKDFPNAKHIHNRFYIWHVLTFEAAYFDGYDKDNNSAGSPYHSDKRFFISHIKLSDID